MPIIILEGVLFVALVAAVVTLVAFLLMNFTPLGTWWRQTRNRRRVERAAELTCPVHGWHAEEQLVRLRSGERICPDCFKEAIDGN